MRIGEDGEDGVALCEHRDAVARAEGTPKYLPVLREHRPVLAAEQLC
jgi:hypothetical protein